MSERPGVFEGRPVSIRPGTFMRGIARAAGWRELSELSELELEQVLERHSRGVEAVRLELERRRQA